MPSSVTMKSSIRRLVSPFTTIFQVDQTKSSRNPSIGMTVLHRSFDMNLDRMSTSKPWASSSSGTASTLAEYIARAHPAATMMSSTRRAECPM